MAKVSEARLRVESYRRSAKAIGAWFEDHAEIVRGLTELRTIGADADAAVAAILAVPAIRTLRLSWELFDTLAQGEGFEPDEFLLGSLSPDDLDACRRGLLGDVIADGPVLSLVSDGG